MFDLKIRNRSQNPNQIAAYRILAYGRAEKETQKTLIELVLLQCQRQPQRSKVLSLSFFAAC